MENKKIHTFTKHGINLQLEKSDVESDYIFMERGWFLVNYLVYCQKNDKIVENLDEAETMSRVWVNSEYLNCKYSESVMKKLSKFCH